MRIFEDATISMDENDTTKITGEYFIVAYDYKMHEVKNVYLINYSNESTKLYDKIGFKICCEWGKLYKDLKISIKIKD